MTDVMEEHEKLEYILGRQRYPGHHLQDIEIDMML